MKTIRGIEVQEHFPQFVQRDQPEKNTKRHSTTAKFSSELNAIFFSF